VISWFLKVCAFQTVLTRAAYGEGGGSSDSSGEGEQSEEGEDGSSPGGGGGDQGDDGSKTAMDKIEMGMEGGEEDEAGLYKQVDP
jgi:hypothetical protein